MQRLTWRKSTRSGGEGNDCVQIAWPQHHAAVRDSKNPHGPILTFSRDLFHTALKKIDHH